VLKALGEADKAAAAFRKAIQIDDAKYPNAHDGLGSALVMLDKLDDAVASYKRAIDLNPKFVLAHTNLAVALKLRGQVPDALAAFDSALKIDPEYAPAHNALAWMLATCPDPKHRDPRRAVGSAKKATRSAPRNVVYRQTLAWAEYRAGDLKAAVAVLDELEELGSPGNSVEWFLRAMAHWQLGDKDTARRNYDRAVAWLEKNAPADDTLRRFRAEAEGLMKIESKKK